MVLKLSHLNQQTNKGCPDGTLNSLHLRFRKVLFSDKSAQYNPQRLTTWWGHSMVNRFESNKTPQGLPFLLVFPHKTFRVPEMAKGVDITETFIQRMKHAPGEQLLHIVFVNTLLHIDQVGGNGIRGDAIGEDAEEGGEDCHAPSILTRHPLVWNDLYR